MKQYITAFIAISLFALGCENNNKNGAENFFQDNNQQDTSETIYLNQSELPPANDVARFLAGKSVDKYSLQQNTVFYRDYAVKAKQQWTDLKSKTLEPIKDWCNNNIPEFCNDTTTLFYPFGGPDLVFAFAFFPNETNYVLQGLENPGSLTMPDKLSEQQTREYLDSLLYSYRYINKYGFFVASHMRDDFKNITLNGTIHLILYTLAMENCLITSYHDVYINEKGQLVESDGKPVKHPYGYKITFVKDGESKQRSIVYLRMDSSNPSLSGKFEFPFFVNSFKDKICYLKSASYLLQGGEFSIIQKIITEQFDRILQDESGLSYARVKKDFDVDIYGTYTRPMKVFANFKQEDLKRDLQTKNSQPLPFKIGYASQINESVLMACTRKGISHGSNIVNNSKVENFKDTVYKVQFKVSWNIISPTDQLLEGIPDVDYYTDNSSYKYTAGCKNSEAECAPILQLVRSKGFSDAFIVKFVNGKRIR